MSKPLQKNEILQYRKISSFYAAVVMLLIAAVAIFLFNATYSDIYILVLLNVFFLSSRGVIDEKVSVSNQHLIIKRRIMCFSLTLKKSWQEITRISQTRNERDNRLNIKFSGGFASLSEPDNAKLYDFANLCSVVKAEAAKFDIPIDITQKDEKKSKLKYILLTLVAVAFTALFWFLLAKLNILMPHATLQYALLIWLVILFVSPYTLSYFYLKYVNTKALYQSEEIIMRKVYRIFYILFLVFSVNYLTTQYLVVPEAKVLELTEENIFHQEWFDKSSNLTFFIRDDDMSYVKNAQVGSQQRFLISDGWLGDHALIAISE